MTGLNEALGHVCIVSTSKAALKLSAFAEACARMVNNSASISARTELT